MTKLNLKINQKVVVPTDDNTQLNGSKQSDIDDYNDSQAAADQVKIKNQGTLKLTKQHTVYSPLIGQQTETPGSETPNDNKGSIQNIQNIKVNNMVIIGNHAAAAASKKSNGAKGQEQGENGSGNLNGVDSK